MPDPAILEQWTLRVEKENGRTIAEIDAFPHALHAVEFLAGQLVRKVHFAPIHGIQQILPAACGVQRVDTEFDLPKLGRLFGVRITDQTKTFGQALAVEHIWTGAQKLPAPLQYDAQVKPRQEQFKTGMRPFEPEEYFVTMG